jgi:ribosomal protein S30
MTSDGFIPLGGEIKAPDIPQFVRHGDAVPEARKDGPKTPSVTPAEKHDLEPRLRQILESQISGDALEEIVDSIKSTIQNTPTRVALPEIKLHPLDAPPEGQPTIAFERDGDTVKSVQVTCSCGQSIHMDCVY